MLTREVRIWLDNVKNKRLSYDDAMYELTNFLPYLTKEELIQFKRILSEINV